MAHARRLHTFSKLFHPKCGVSIFVTMETFLVSVVDITRTKRVYMSLFTPILKIKVTAVPVHAVEAVENCGLVALILNRGTRWRWVANFTTRSPYLREELHSLNMKLGWSLDMVWTVWRGFKYLSPTEIRTPGFFSPSPNRHIHYTFPVSKQAYFFLFFFLLLLLLPFFFLPFFFFFLSSSSSSSSSSSMALQPNANLRLLNVFLPVCPFFGLSFRFAILHMLISVCTHFVCTNRY